MNLATGDQEDAGFLQFFIADGRQRLGTFTSFFASSFSVAIFSISCDFDICTAISVSYELIHATDSIGGIQPKHCANVAIYTALLMGLANLAAHNRKLRPPDLASG
jgi:hypothetical protein